MKKSIIVFLLMGMVLLSGCAGSETIVTSGDEASEIVSDSVQQSSDSLSKAESSLSNYDDDVIFRQILKNMSHMYVAVLIGLMLIQIILQNMQSCLHRVVFTVVVTDMVTIGAKLILWMITTVLLLIFALLSLRGLSMRKPVKHLKQRSITCMTMMEILLRAV